MTTGTEKVQLRGAAATLLFTLYLRRLDALTDRPILGDPYAVATWDRIEHDVSRIGTLSGDSATVVSRAAILDGWTREFLAEHPDGQVLHLGCGLDSRPLRLDVPATCRWIDVDQPEVMDIRARLYDVPAHVEQVAASVADDDWWDEVDTLRPTLVLAEGLLMYLPPTAVDTIVHRVTTRLSRGVLAFDAVSPWTQQLSRLTKLVTGVDTRFQWSWDGTEFAHRHPALRERDDVSVYDEAMLRTPNPWRRAWLAALGVLPGFADMMRLHRFRF
ncbi:class I SAM-dependent methyltransferase [Pseudonocardia phyllosphaerae]|uniref:class I SAM-dependent methyltransferase n=1 Tax=Pseudonocardia phyllosphaerae TaxID=3390502 RepID=UPI00397C3759